MHKKQQENVGAKPEEKEKENEYVDSHGKFHKGQEVAVIRNNGAMERGWKLLLYNIRTEKWSAVKNEIKEDERGETRRHTMLRTFREDQIGELLEGTPEL